jgi:hypothetical protein
VRKALAVRRRVVLGDHLAAAGGAASWRGGQTPFRREILGHKHGWTRLRGRSLKSPHEEVVEVHEAVGLVRRGQASRASLLSWNRSISFPKQRRLGPSYGVGRKTHTAAPSPPLARTAR